MHDRTAFYLAYGCLAFLPMVYLTPTYGIATQPGETSSPWVACLCIILGLASLAANYGTDLQKQQFKEDGTISWLGFGRRPAAFITDGKRRLLTDGFWVARKMNYTFEIMTAFFWTLPAGFNSIVPWYYVIYLTLLLIHRCYRDDKRCLMK